MEDLLTDISKGNRKHMTLSDRIIIEQGLNQQMTFKSIAASIEKDPSSISKEIRRYLLWSGEDPVPYKGNDCVHYKTCTIDMLCMWDCSRYCKDCNRKASIPQKKPSSDIRSFWYLPTPASTYLPKTFVKGSDPFTFVKEPPLLRT